MKCLQFISTDERIFKYSLTLSGCSFWFKSIERRIFSRFRINIDGNPSYRRGKVFSRCPFININFYIIYDYYIIYYILYNNIEDIKKCWLVWCSRRNGPAGELLELFLWECLAWQMAEEVDERGSAASHQCGGERTDDQSRGQNDHLY